MTLETKVQEHSFKGPSAGSRFGLHYFPNTAHYHTADLAIWLPKLRSLSQGLTARWVVLPAPVDRAIPEDFIAGLRAAGIEPILHFQLPLEKAANLATLEPLFEAYAKWGVRYAVLFDRPNLRSQWPHMGWTQRGLVQRFLQIFTPVAEAAMDAGLTPVFPALEPGGDYWDTAFLRGALEALQESGEERLLDKLALGAYAWSGDKDLAWGEGGPERWPATLPYSTPENSQDQRGFRIFDWYNAVSAASIGRTLPIIIVAAGGAPDGEADPAQVRSILSALDAADMPANVIAANLWLLAAEDDDPAAEQAWFDAEGDPNAVAEALLGAQAPASEPVLSAASFESEAAAHSLPAAHSGVRPIRHYLLLPGADLSGLELAKDFIASHQPTIGYSVQEAQHAQRVTLAGGLHSFSDETIRALIQAGCQVETLPAAA
jgi:hypothetical protein